MIYVRCKFYDDEGRLIPLPPGSKGCRGADCLFVHPSHPNWKFAPRKQIATQEDYTKSRPRPYKPTPLSPSDPKLKHLSNVRRSVEEQRASSSTKQDFDSSSWGAPAFPGVDGHPSGELPEWTPAPIDEDKSSGGGEWGGAGGWGALDNMFPGSVASTWAPPQSSQTWKGSSSSSGHGLRDISYSASAPVDKPSDMTPLLTARPATREPTPPLPVVRRTRPLRMSSAPSVPPTPVDTGPRPPPLPVSLKGKEVDRNIYKHPSSLVRALEPTDGVSLLAQIAIDPREPRTQPVRTSKSKGKTVQKPVTPEERKKVYRGVVKHVQMLVTLTIQLQRAQTDLNRWKKIRNADHYMHSTMATRAQLLDANTKLAGKVEELRKKREKWMSTLLDLPDIPTRAKIYDFEADTQKIIDYTTELRRWMNDLDLARRLEFLQPSPSPEPTQPEIPTNEQAIRGADTQTRHEEIQWTWDLLDNHLAALHQKIQEIEGNIGLSLSTDLSAHNAAFEEFLQVVKAKKLAKKLGKLNASLDKENTNLNGFDQRLKASVQNAYTFFEKIKQMEDYMEAMKKETNELNKINEEDERLLDELEAKQKEKQDLIKEITEQLQEIALIRKSSPPGDGYFAIEDMTPKIRQMLVDRLTEELKPILQSAIGSTKQNADNLQAEFDRFLEPLLAKTERVVGLVLQMRSTQAS